MEKKGIIILVGVIIIILAVLCVLFATGTITFNNDDSNEVKGDNDTRDIIEEKNKNEIFGSYKYSVNIAEGTYRIYEITFSNNNEVSYMINVSNSVDTYDGTPVIYYTGTYVLENNKIILTLKAKTQDGSECIDGKYACDEMMTFKLSDNQLIDLEDQTVIYQKN